MSWGFESLLRNVASTMPVPAGGVFDGFNQGTISIKTKRVLPYSWEVRAVLQQVAAYTLDSRRVPGAAAELGDLWGSACPAGAWQVSHVPSVFLVEQYLIFQG